MNSAKGKFKPGLLATIVALHVMVVWGLWQSRHGVPGTVLWAAFGFYCLRGLGVTVGYHRYWTHGAFKCSRPAQIGLAIIGSLAMQKSIADWRRDHQQHHAYTDRDWDPHSPKAYPQPWGFLWAHTGWILFQTLRRYEVVGRREHDWVVRLQHLLYWPIGVGLGFILPFKLWGWPGLYWCGFIGVVGFLHVTWCVNSICHLWGTRPLDTKGKLYQLDDSRNNLGVALLGFGEGHHGNHHVKQSAANLGRGHWFDPGWWLIRGMETVGLAWEVNTFERRS